LFVERGDTTATEVAQRLAQAMERASIEFPAGVQDAGRTAQVASARNMAAFRAATSQGAVFSDEAGTFVVMLDPPLEEPPLFLPRTLAIRSVADPAEALEYLRRHEIPLEGFALSASREDLVQMAVNAGAVRLVRFGELQQPPLEGEHGGRPRIAEFVRWTTRNV
jgi:Acyl-CoA reductase (LuxC)